MYTFIKIRYKDLNSKAKEMYNFQKVSSVLADYGFTTMWLNNDWQGADFIAVHFDGVTDLKIQLKSRLTFDKKYINKNIFICFIEENEIYMYPHDIVLNNFKQAYQYINNNNSPWSNKKLTKEQKKLLDKYIL